MDVRALAEKSKRIAASQGKIEYFVGPAPDGPRLCMHCHKEFVKGEAWQRLTSPPDPDFGSYIVGIHRKCQGKAASTK